LKQKSSTWIKIWLVPGAVYQSVIVGGGYGTGREVVEFISRNGPWNGLYANIFIGLLMGLVMAVSFDFARTFKAMDYRTFFKKLLGPLWFLYEIVFLITLLLVLAVTGSAAGEVLHDTFGLPSYAGILLMLLIVVLLNYFGRQWVESTLTIWGLLMSLVLLIFVVATFLLRGDAIAASFAADPADSSWITSAFQFFLFNIFLVPVTLYAAEHIQTRRQAWGAGMIGGFLAIFPGLIFHLSFMAGYPDILEQPIPTYWLLRDMGLNGLLLIYVVFLFGTIAQTGVGVLQGINERLDNWLRERTGKPLRPEMHSAIAVTAIVSSLLLANLGIVALVAKGYGSLAWFSLGIYILPILTLGVYKLYQSNL
jgi:uncharacterized membrane protein YkvI